MLKWNYYIFSRQNDPPSWISGMKLWKGTSWHKDGKNEPSYVQMWWIVFLQCMLQCNFFNRFSRQNGTPSWIFGMTLLNCSFRHQDGKNESSYVRMWWIVFVQCMLKWIFIYVPAKMVRHLGLLEWRYHKHFPTSRRKEWAIIRRYVTDSFFALHVKVELFIYFPANMIRHLRFLEWNY